MTGTGRNVQGQVAQLDLGMFYTSLFKRPTSQSLRFRAWASVGLLTAVSLFLISRQEGRRRSSNLR